MNRRDIRRELIKCGHDPALVEKAIKKAERWMRAAYGSIDWEELQNETGDAVGNVMGYLVETKDQPDGRKTFNRGYL